MGAMKELFLEMQDNTYEKLAQFGVSQRRLMDLEEWFIDADHSFEDFAEKAAAYAVRINILAFENGYTTERLWDIWTEMLDDFFESEDSYTDKQLADLWDDFKQTTMEKDW